MIDIFGDWNDAPGMDEDNDHRRSDADKYTSEAFDKYLTAEIVTDSGGDILRGTVKSRKKNQDGKPIGSFNPNPLLDTRDYLVCFNDGTEEFYTANLIAECLYSQMDEEGRRLQMMHEIVDHEKLNSAIREEDSYYSTKVGRKPKRTTKGWRLLVEWKDGFSTWVPLAGLTDYFPVQVENMPIPENMPILENMPTPRGKDVTMSCFVNADHAECRETRQSHSGILNFVNRAPILWYSKRQNTVEASTYGSELLAMRLSIEMIEGLRYKLRMMGVHIEGECAVFCKNSAVVTNARPESTLKKKYTAINFHRVREAIAAETIKVAKESTQTNLAEILTKLMSGTMMKKILENILW